MESKYCVNAKDLDTHVFEQYDYTQLLTEKNGCLAGCRTGILSYRQTEYIQGGVHDDQEGFYVLEGYGSAKVGDEEFPISPGSCFIAPARKYHYIRRAPECPFVKLFFFHAASDGSK